MDTLNDWTEDGYETQLVSIDTPPLQASLSSVEAQHVPDNTSESEGTVISAETHLAPLGTLLTAANGQSYSSCEPDSEACEPVSSESAQVLSSEPKTELVSPSSKQLSSDASAADFTPFPTKSTPGNPVEREISPAFLDYFLTYPIIKNLRAADLLNKQEVLEAARIWKQMGGKLEHVLVDRMGIKSTTIKFFHNNEAGTSAKQQGCKRIGEFLRAAGLVSEGEIQFVLEELKTQGRSLKLGDALVEQGLVKQSTIDYFANRFVNNDLDFEGQASGEDSTADHIDDDSHFRMDEFFFVVGQHGQFSSHTLRTRMYSIGRAVGNDIVVNDRFVSRRHAYLIRTQDKDTHATTYEVLDCGKIHKYSTNGIYVNGRKVKHQALKAGDVVHIGPKIHARFLPVE